MEEIKGWIYEKKGLRAVEALKRNNFKAFYYPDKDTARREILQMIPEGSTIGIGGSISLGEIGLFTEIKERASQLINPSSKKLSPEEVLDLRKKALTCDVFLTGTNAVTENGELYNIDMAGNRVGAMAFGPRKTIVVAGVNKIVPDLEAARKRVKEWAAPMNSKRLGFENPCVQMGKCMDCSSPQRICNITVIIEKNPSSSDITVCLIGEELGL